MDNLLCEEVRIANRERKWSMMRATDGQSDEAVVELQAHGYLVARVLADDVVEPLEKVMEMILAAGAFRRLALLSLEAKS